MSLKRRINTHMRVNYQRIPHDRIIDAQFALGNANCHHNAVAAVRAGRADAVWMVWAGHGDQGCVHFINSKEGKFFDETWHDESNRQDYYIIRKVRPDEYDDVYDLLVDCKWMLANLLATRWQRWRMKQDSHRYM